MNNYPRSYFRAKSALYTLSEFKTLSSNFSDDFNTRQAMLNIIKRSFVSYWKFLKDLLKEKGIIEYYPRRIIKCAVINNIIQKEELIWLEYIDLLNSIIYNPDEQKKIDADTIISVYTPRVESIYNYMFSVYPDLKNPSPNKSYDFSFDKSKPLYSPSEIGIKDNFYELLINFFVSNPEIKNVWLHGSRVSGKFRENSDIDLLIDSPLETFDQLNAKMHRVRIPYRTDASNIYDDSQLEFNSIVSKQAKIIYRAIDYK